MFEEDVGRGWLIRPICIQLSSLLYTTFIRVCTLLSARIYSSPCSELKNRAGTKIEYIEEKIKTLKGMKKALVELSRACSGRGPISECPILESLEE